MNNMSIDPYFSSAEVPRMLRRDAPADEVMVAQINPGENGSCDLLDRMIAFGIPMEPVFAGEYTAIYSGHADAVYDPHALAGFVLRARAISYRGIVDIGFDTSGNIVRSLLDFNVISADEALTLWFMASRDGA